MSVYGSRRVDARADPAPADRQHRTGGGVAARHPGSGEPEGAGGGRTGEGAVLRQEPVRVGAGRAGREHEALRGEGHVPLQGAQFAVVQDGGGTAEDEVDVALDVAVAEVLPGEDGQVRRVRVEGVLVAQEAAVVEGAAVARDLDGDGLGSGDGGIRGAQPVVGEGEVAGGEAVGLEGDGRAARRAVGAAARLRGRRPRCPARSRCRRPGRSRRAGSGTGATAGRGPARGTFRRRARSRRPSGCSRRRRPGGCGGRPGRPGRRTGSGG